MQIVFADRTDDHFPRVHSHPHQERRTPLFPEGICIPPHFLLHTQCGIQRSLRMVLMRYWRAEQRKNTIA